MTRRLLFLCIFIASYSILSAQPWARAPYLKKTAPAEGSKIGNESSILFSDLQAAFNAYWATRSPSKGSGYKPFMRWLNDQQTRLMPDGSYPSAAFIRDEINHYRSSHPGNSLQSVTSNWTNINMSDNITAVAGVNYTGSGQITCIAMNPVDSSTLVATSSAGGIWKSVDGGNNWNLAFAAYPAMGFTSIVYDPNNANTLYAVTGDYRTSGWGYGFTYGLIRSTDGGATWSGSLTPMYATYQNRYVMSRVLVNPLLSQTLLISGGLGIHKSTDGGATWVASSPVLSNVRTILYMPGDTTVVYASTDVAFYKSTDGGVTFTQVTNGFPVTNISKANLAVTANAPNNVYALISDSLSDFKGFYKSMDMGSTWTELYDHSTKNILCNDSAGGTTYNQGWWCLSLTVSQNDSNEIYTGGINIWHSTDGGMTFNPFTSYYPLGNLIYTHADEQFLYKVPGQNLLLVGNDGGFHKIYTGSSPYIHTLNHGLNNTLIYKINDDPNDPNHLYAGLQDNGSYIYKAGTWTNINQSDAMTGSFDNMVPNKIYMSGNNGEFRRSDDGGLTRTSIAPGGTSYWQTPIVIEPNGNTLLYGEQTAVKLSLDSGGTWNPISSNLNTSGVEIHYITADTSANNVFVVTVPSGQCCNNKVWKTTDQGNTWTDVTSGITTIWWIQNIYVDPVVPTHVWATSGGYDAGNKVYESKDGGTTWINISGTLPNIPVNCIAQDKSSPVHAVYIGTDWGVFYRDTTMNDWSAFNTNLPNARVNDLKINTTSGMIRAGTWGHGMWESPLNGIITSVPAVGIKQSLLRVQPNPNDGSFILSLQAFGSEQADIQIVDMLGRTVYAEKLICPGGSCIKPVTLSQLAKGVYELRVSGTNTRLSEKVVVK